MTAKRQKAHKDRPVYLAIRKMVDPETGELVGCLVPASWADQQIMRDRKYRTGDVLRSTFNHPRNSNFHRLVHQLGTAVRENIEGFEGMDSHAVIKRLQRESGVYCETQTVDAAPMATAIMLAVRDHLGDSVAKMLAVIMPEIKTVQVITPRSIAWDCMDEADFKRFWEGICNHLIANYWPTLDEYQITEIAELMPDGGA